jgi:8-oxo-dGTP pyrophosphatase MutT (NUDIX family)
MARDKGLGDRGDGYLCDAHGESARRCCAGARWGRFGAAGIVFVFDDEDGYRWYLLNERSSLISCGGMWSCLGGALDKGETPLVGAIREVTEEIGYFPKRFSVLGSVTNRHESGWEYTTFVVKVDVPFAPLCHDWESVGTEWFKFSGLLTLDVHPSLRSAWWSVVDAGR